MRINVILKNHIYNNHKVNNQTANIPKLITQHIQCCIGSPAYSLSVFKYIDFLQIGQQPFDWYHSSRHES